MRQWKVVVGQIRCFTTGTGNVKGNPAFAKTAKAGAPANSKTNSKTKSQAKQINHKMSCPSGIISGATRSILGSTDVKGRATRARNTLQEKVDRLEGVENTQRDTTKKGGYRISTEKSKQDLKHGLRQIKSKDDLQE
jgi:hypothetical protein